MTLLVHADRPPLELGADGAVRVSGTRVPLERVVRAFLAGSTPEQIAQDFEVLPLKNVYAVVNYYLHHRSEVDAYLAESDAIAARERTEAESILDPTGIRARLMARRPQRAN